MVEPALGDTPVTTFDMPSDEGGGSGSDSESDDGSLFSAGSSSSPSPSPSCPLRNPIRIATRKAPPIPGLFFFQDLLSPSLCSRVLASVAECCYFSGDAGRNQVMLFARAQSAPGYLATGATNGAKKRRKMAEPTEPHMQLPAWVTRLIQELQVRLHHLVDDTVHRLLFSPYSDQRVRSADGDDDNGSGKDDDVSRQLRSRQLILNLYRPGEGLSSHVDLMRFGDGIMLASFGAQNRGTVMEFTPADAAANTDEDVVHALYLPPGSVLVLSGEARYRWKHGIPARDFDLVRDEQGKVTRLPRGTRLSVTIRWMSPGGDVVGQEDEIENGPVPM
ncbi:hypothetical protein ACQY0O_001142 [Thecaphora frezii]